MNEPRPSYLAQECVSTSCTPVCVLHHISPSGYQKRAEGTELLLCQYSSIWLDDKRRSNLSSFYLRTLRRRGSNTLTPRRANGRLSLISTAAACNYTTHGVSSDASRIPPFRTWWSCAPITGLYLDIAITPTFVRRCPLETLSLLIDLSLCIYSNLYLNLSPALYTYIFISQIRRWMVPSGEWLMYL